MKKVKIFSSGGCGTRWLQGITKFYTIPVDVPCDFPTHLPASVVKKNFIVDRYLDKGILIYADPREVFLHIIRKQPDRRIKHFQHLGCEAEETSRLLEIGNKNRLGNIEKELHQVKSFKGLENHYDDWIKTKFPIDVAFVKSESLAIEANGKKLGEFLELEESEIFGQVIADRFSPRQTKLSQCSPSQRAHLNNLFGSLVRKQASKPPVWIKKRFMVPVPTENGTITLN